MWDALYNSGKRLEAGEYDTPLPPPDERRRIRKAAGWTQQDVADEILDWADREGVTDIEVDRWSVGRFEKPAGYVDGKRLRGQEPTGEPRRLYAQILGELEEQSS